MNDHDIRTAFENLDRDVRAGIQTELRLEQITAHARTTPRRPVFAIVAAAAAVIIVVGGALLALRPGVTTTTVPPATTGPTTTLAEPSTTTTTALDTTLTPGMPVVEPGMVLVADMGVQVLEIADDYVAYMADRVIGDGADGIVVQLDRRLIHITRSGDSVDIADERDLGTDDAPAAIRLEDIDVTDGQRRVLYTVTRGSGLDVVQEVWSHDLNDGTTELILRKDGEGDFESTITRVSAAGDLMVLTMSAPGTTYFEFYSAAGEPSSVSGPTLGVDGFFTDFDKPVHEGVLSPDGATLAYLQFRDITTGEDGYYVVDVIVWDVLAGTETERLELMLGDGESSAWPGRMDYDGVGIVLGRPLTTLRVVSITDGESSEIPVAGSPSFVK